MPEPQIRFFLHSAAAATGHRVIYPSVGVGEKRCVRLAAGPTPFTSVPPPRICAKEMTVTARLIRSSTSCARLAAYAGHASRLAGRQRGAPGQGLPRVQQAVRGLNFDPEVKPAAVDEKWAKRYTAFLVRDTPLFTNTATCCYSPASSA